MSRFSCIGTVSDTSEDEVQRKSEVLRAAMTWDLMGRKLVEAAAHGNIVVCRQVLQDEKMKRESCLPPKIMSPSTYTAAVASASSTVLSPPAEPDPPKLINFMSEGHCPLQAAAQNGHAKVCEMLIVDYGADIEFEVCIHTSCLARNNI